MRLSLRQQQILQAARTQSQVMVDELVELFAVTPQTIRKDLNELCERELLLRIHGGAVLATGAVNVSYERRRAMAAHEKARLAQLCAAHIPDNSSLFINVGTTTEAVARALLEHRDLLIVTNNLHVANILSQNSGFEVIVAGGTVRHEDHAIVGEAASDFIRQFKLDYAVMGISALDEEGALLDYDYREVRVAQAILQNARQRFLVVDHSKLDRHAPVRVSHITQLSAIFIDELSSEKLSGLCQQAGVAIHTLHTNPATS